MTQIKDQGVSEQQVEFVHPNSEDDRIEKTVSQLDGTVQLTSDRGIVLIPTPSQDPRDPLNIPLWHKLIVLGITCIYSTMGLTAVSGLGGILGYFIPQYASEGRTYDDISALMTYPSLFMGLGNFVSMPIALAIGRRPVFFASTVLQVAALALCATNQGYEWHFGARCVLGLAAGQSEALCPLIISEIFFLHERAKYQQLFSSIQTCISATLIILTSYIASTIGWRSWYWLFAGFSGVIVILTFFFVPESKFDRPLQAYKGVTTERGIPKTLDGGFEDSENVQVSQVITVNDERTIDNINYAPRTWKSNIAMFTTKAEWSEAVNCLKHMFQVFFFPDVLWITAMNGVFLGINIALGLTYGNILSGSYGWAQKYISVAQAGQLVVAFIAAPALGYGSDFIVRYMARRNGGVHEPEFRLLPLIVPLVLGVMFSVIYGQAAAHPERFHWMGIVFPLNGYYFTFLGSNMAGITYLLDAYPTRGGPALVVLCAMRGVISFSLSYGTVKLYNSVGYDGAFGLFGGLTAAFGVIGVFVFYRSKKIRRFVQPWTVAKDVEFPVIG